MTNKRKPQLKKPTRGASGVAVITLLTKPWPCPGQCIFCPNDPAMPKSYLSDEPAAQRSSTLEFNAFYTTWIRLAVLMRGGHDISKAEIIINGGTWDAYPFEYREEVVKHVFLALNNFNPHTEEKLLPTRHITSGYVKHVKEQYKSLTSQADDINDLLTANETSICRCVGLSVELRPDSVWPLKPKGITTIKELRQHGVTKVQIGIQSMSDEILLANKRGHTAQQSREAVNYLRQAGFKINAHYMPNLLLATPKSDLADFANFLATIHPDELKIYPTSLLKGTKLYQYYRQGKYQPYTTRELINLLSEMKKQVQPYTRINRVFRDIPGHYITAGNKKTNLRQLVQNNMKKQGPKCLCIRCRQVKPTEKVTKLVYQEISYQTDTSEEHFLQYIDKKSKALLGFLRLSLPRPNKLAVHFPHLQSAAIIREVHVYGVVTSIGQPGKHVQHKGLGRQLIKKAEEISKDKEYCKLTVISAIGTKKYYEKLEFTATDLHYMEKTLS